MPWHYKSPQSFPAAYIAAIREAANNLNEPYMLGGFTSRKSAEILAEKFRYLRWCIRQDASAHPEMFNIISNYDVRTVIKSDAFDCFTLWLIVKPTKVSEFIEHNPILAEEILPLVS